MSSLPEMESTSNSPRESTIVVKVILGECADSPVLYGTNIYMLHPKVKSSMDERDVSRLQELENTLGASAHSLRFAIFALASTY